jgi:hypothetical protein
MAPAAAAAAAAAPQRPLGISAAQAAAAQAAAALASAAGAVSAAEAAVASARDRGAPALERRAALEALVHARKRAAEVAELAAEPHTSLRRRALLERPDNPRWWSAPKVKEGQGLIEGASAAREAAQAALLARMAGGAAEDLSWMAELDADAEARRARLAALKEEKERKRRAEEEAALSAEPAYRKQLLSKGDNKRWIATPLISSSKLDEAAAKARTEAVERAHALLSKGGAAGGGSSGSTAGRTASEAGRTESEAGGGPGAGAARSEDGLAAATGLEESAATVTCADEVEAPARTEDAV